jgi:hypothetical protein
MRPGHRPGVQGHDIWADDRTQVEDWIGPEGLDVAWE